MITVDNTHSCVNLNYLREYHNQNIIVNKENKLYETRFELDRHYDYGKKEFGEKLSLLDWLIINRIQNVSLTGLTFERSGGTIKHLKADFNNEAKSERKFVADLKENLLIVHSSSDFRELFLDFLKANEFRYT